MYIWTVDKLPLKCLVDDSSSPIFKSSNVVEVCEILFVAVDIPELVHRYMMAEEEVTVRAAMHHSPSGGTSPETQSYVEEESFQ